MAAFVPPKDRVLEHSSTAGTGPYALGGAVDTSYNAFSASMAVGDWTIGAIIEPGVAFASGVLTYSATNQITLTTTKESKGTFGSGTKEIMMGLPASSALMVDGDQSLSTTMKEQLRKNIYASVFDARSENNIIVNGNFQVSQELGLAGVGLVATGTYQTKYVLDGFYFGYRGSFVASAGVPDIRTGAGNIFPGIANGIIVQVSTAQASLGANDELTLITPIEGYRISNLVWGYAASQPVTVGFWAFSADATRTISGSIRNSAKNRSYPFSFTLTAAVPAFVTVTIPADTAGTWLADNGVGLYLTLCLAGGTSRLGAAATWAAADLIGVTGSANGVATTAAQIYIGGPIMLPGNEAPHSGRAALLMRPFQRELLLCQRYFCTDFPTGVAPADNVQKIVYDLYTFAAGGTSLVNSPIPFPVRMRAAPTVTLFSSTAKASPAAGKWQLFNGSAWVDFTGSSVGTSTPQNFVGDFSSGSALALNAAFLCAGSWKADARL